MGYAAQHAFKEDFWIIPPPSSSSSNALQKHCLRGSYILPLGTKLQTVWFVQLSGKPLGPLLFAGS